MIGGFFKSLFPDRDHHERFSKLQKKLNRKINTESKIDHYRKVGKHLSETDEKKRAAAHKGILSIIKKLIEIEVDECYFFLNEPIKSCEKFIKNYPGQKEQIRVLLVALEENILVHEEAFGELYREYVRGRVKKLQLKLTSERGFQFDLKKKRDELQGKRKTIKAMLRGDNLSNIAIKIQIEECIKCIELSREVIEILIAIQTIEEKSYSGVNYEWIRKYLKRPFKISRRAKGAFVGLAALGFLGFTAKDVSYEQVVEQLKAKYESAKVLAEDIAQSWNNNPETTDEQLWKHIKEQPPNSYSVSAMNKIDKKKLSEVRPPTLPDSSWEQDAQLVDSLRMEFTGSQYAPLVNSLCKAALTSKYVGTGIDAASRRIYAWGYGFQQMDCYLLVEDMMRKHEPEFFKGYKHSLKANNEYKIDPLLLAAHKKLGGELIFFAINPKGIPPGVAKQKWKKKKKERFETYNHLTAARFAVWADEDGGTILIRNVNELGKYIKVPKGFKFHSGDNLEFTYKKKKYNRTKKSLYIREQVTFSNIVLGEQNIQKLFSMLDNKKRVGIVSFASGMHGGFTVGKHIIHGRDSRVGKGTVSVGDLYTYTEDNWNFGVILLLPEDPRQHYAGIHY